MADPRVQRFAELLVKYSIYAKPKETIGVEGSAEAEPLFEAVYEEMLKAGAYPVLRMTPRNASETLLSNTAVTCISTRSPRSK